MTCEQHALGSNPLSAVELLEPSPELALADRPFVQRVVDNTCQLDKTIHGETGRLDGLRHDLGEARRLNARRPEMESRLHDVEGQLADDRRIRTRQLRRNPPERITHTIGQRSTKSDRIRAWDNAVGYLDQHQAAHGLTAGLGQTQGPSVTKTFLHSRALAASTANKLTHDNGISHDNVMHIGP